LDYREGLKNTTANTSYKSWRHGWYLIWLFWCAATPYSKTLQHIKKRRNEIISTTLSTRDRVQV